MTLSPLSCQNGSRKKALQQKNALAHAACVGISLVMARPLAAPPKIFDRKRYAARRSRAAARFADYDYLRQRVASDLESRLGDTPRRFEHGLELGAAGGALSRKLLATGKVARMLAADIAPAFTRMAQAIGLEAATVDEEHLPFPEATFDLVLAPLTLHWVNDLPGALIQIRRILKPDGLFLGALFGSGTLAELRAVLTEAETELTGGLTPRFSPLPGLRDMADLLQRTGFALPVADRDTVDVTFSHPAVLLSDLKGMGERASFVAGTSRALSAPVLARATELYAERFAAPRERVRASFEIVHVSGWAPGPGQPQPLKPGSARLSLADAVKRTPPRLEP